jgi:hypothetical protein
MAALKTQATKASVKDFISAIPDEQRRKDCQEIAAMMESATKAKAVMWGTSIVGFGDFEYAGSNGKSTKWFLAGFSPRKQALTLYLMGGKDQELLAQLGKASMGGSCLYIKKLDDVHRPTLRRLIAASLKQLKATARKKAS